MGVGPSFALPVAVTSKYIERFGNRHFRGAVASTQGWRLAMEDSHIAQLGDQHGLFGVLDGHAGSTCSSICAEMLRTRIGEAALPLSDNELQRLVLDVDADFLRTHTLDDSGSTAVLGLVYPSQDGYTIQVANVGDSRIIVGTGGAARPLTTDHKPSHPIETARIKAAGGFVEMDRVNGDLAVSRALGDRPYKVKTSKLKPGKTLAKPKPLPSSDPRELQVVAVPEITRAELKAGDWLLAACDGIFEPESFTNEEVADFIQKQMKVCNDLGKVVCALCTEALKRGSTDNMTAMIVQCTDGTDFGPAAEFLPGPYLADMGRARRSYFDFARDLAGLSRGRTLELRYDLLKQRLADLESASRDPPLNFSCMTPAELRQWLQKHGRTDQLPTKRVALSRLCKEEIAQHRHYTEDDPTALTQELDWYKGGPPDNMQGDQRTAWFANLVDEGSLETMDDDDEEGIALDNLSPEQLQQLVERGMLQELQEEIAEAGEEGQEDAEGAAPAQNAVPVGQKKGKKRLLGGVKRPLKKSKKQARELGESPLPTNA